MPCTLSCTALHPKKGLEPDDGLSTDRPGFPECVRQIAPRPPLGRPPMRSSLGSARLYIDNTVQLASWQHSPQTRIAVAGNHPQSIWFLVVMDTSIPTSLTLLNATTSTIQAATFPNTSPAPALCTLTPQARALSTVLTAFLGSLLSGLSGGWFTAFYVAAVCWMAALRLLLVGVWMLSIALHGQALEGGDQFHDFYGRVPGLGKLVNGFGGMRDFDDPFFREGQGIEASEPGVLGWVAWCWGTVYAPMVQMLWLVENWRHASGSLKIVRAIGVSVTALPLTMDTRARYGAVLGRRIGSWSAKVFNFWTAASCLTLGVIASIELVLGAIEVPVTSFVIAIYVLFMLTLTYSSFIFATPHDEARTANSFGALFAGLAMGVFGGLFTAFPAAIILETSKKTPGVGLAAYMRCEHVALWRKVITVLP